MNVVAYPKDIVSFKSNPLISVSSFIEDRVLLNKALIDGAKDVSIIVNANNRNEREERFIRSCIAWGSAFLTPLVTLPVTNKLAMKHVAKLTKTYFSHDNNLIKLSNKYLSSKDATKFGIEELARKYDFTELLKVNGHDYEKIRKKIINAKTSVLAFDFLFTSATLGSAGFVNRYRTRKKTGMDGFSAEFKMADKNIVEKRAEKFKKSENLRSKIFLGILLAFATTPLLLRKGLLSNGKFSNLVKKHADKFDYNDGIFMKRLPFFLMVMVADTGYLLSSRNKTEVKDNAVRLYSNQFAYFGADILIGSALASLSDKFLKTELLKKDCKKTLVNKLIPPIKPIKDLIGKNKAIATGFFWINMCTLFSLVGVVIPKMLNKIIKHDVEKDVQKQNKNIFANHLPTATKPIRLEDFIKNS